ncbi:unnamed protein product [Aspergillus oryzae]|nr:unnamed protein product [Aspergillus oryzae]
MPLSENTALRLAGNAFGTIILGFGINALIRPDHALTFFEWTPPTVTADRQLVNSLMYVYGVRDIYMGLSVYVASIFGTPKSLGWTLLAFSAVAALDLGGDRVIEVQRSVYLGFYRMIVASLSEIADFRNASEIVGTDRDNLH